MAGVSKATNSDVCTIEEEIENLRKEFDGQCKVIDTEGKFVKTVKLHPTDLDIVFNFKITATYPTTRAVIEVRSEALNDDEIYDLQTYLKQLNDSPNMESMVKLALEWLRKENIDVRGSKKKKLQTDGREKQRKQRRKPKDENDKGKKPPMKTAMDVVKRIMWDGELDRDQFLVGYIDRMDGLKEKYFNAFSWEDIASVDYTVLAIPKHRIQYFKYRGVIVWDKRCRLDNVFGSTGSKTTIKEVIAKLDGPVNDGGDDNDSAGGAVGGAVGGVGVGGGNGQENQDGRQDDIHDDSDYYDSGDYSDTDSDDDSDDGITVTIGNMNATGGIDDDDDNDRLHGRNGNSDNEADGEDAYDKYWRDKLRPNYFIALRITDDDIRENAVRIQKQVTEQEPRLRRCSIPPGAMHLTLATVGLETPEQVQNAVQCLKEAQSELSDFIPKGIKLRFKGVSTFFNRVIYVRVIECPQEFYDFVDHLKTCLSSQGIEIRDYHEFVPHMTIMKVSRPVARVTGNNYIAPWLYSSFNETELGSQGIDNIHLCAMVDERRDDGFYMTAASLEL